MACRFPGSSSSPSEFWEALVSGRDCCGPIPRSRWNHDLVFSPDPDAPGKAYAREGAFIEGVELFDNAFFGISAAEAAQMDPQQRHMLEVSWEAFAHSGLRKEDLEGSSTAVFVGCTNFDWVKRSQQCVSPVVSSIGSLSYTGESSCLLANRISRVLDLTGPSMTIDTATSASLVALDCAFSAISLGRCVRALSGGVNLMLSPQPFVAFSRTRMLSPDNRCKTFDASANGYVRGEGVGAVLLESLETAERNKRTVLAVVRGTAVNHVGFSSSLTAPKSSAQAALIRSALVSARVRPSDVSFVETHGTGTRMGDPAEFAALREVYGEGRGSESPLVLGAVKTNIGHLEGAAGIAGFIKLVLVLQHRAAPPNLHLKTLNPHLDVDGFPVVFPKEKTALSAGLEGEREGGALLGAVSSFGFGGANAHVVVEAFRGSHREGAGACRALPADVCEPCVWLWERFPLPPTRDAIIDPQNNADCLALRRREGGSDGSESPLSASRSTAAASLFADPQKVEELTLEAVRRVSKNGPHAEVPMDAPLYDLVDSLGAEELCRVLSDTLYPLVVSPKMLFDHPNVLALTHFLSDKLRTLCPRMTRGTHSPQSNFRSPQTSENARTPTPESPASARSCAQYDSQPRTPPRPAVSFFAPAPCENKQMAVCGMACRFPGSSSSPSEFWEALVSGRECCGPIPRSRWNHDLVFSPDPDAPGKAYAREGAFIEGVELFDNAFFGISAAEAAQMDPQQRHMLEVSWETLHSAGFHSRESLKEREGETGVFIGAFNGDWSA
eukprot:Cvel_24323.t1-p1 / transcript=Cvel_24323.t1 / gene=Cvel_24323 / organism=Chromera_velia_CCMP2878 / gene_product=Putative inactive phenolphthiocerol synthesis, putative / transcript_product=Putative inactive phenolphthiocerol synthesis, putative / location=Cvel_scaffold2614:23603-26241(+) / protein_length=782 / sequence_SO=supercontig / SO=protein_coding / is_pseudo=false